MSETPATEKVERKPGRPRKEEGLSKEWRDKLSHSPQEEGKEVYVIVVGKTGWKLSKFFAYWYSTIIALATGYSIGVIFGTDWLYLIVGVFGATAFLGWIWHYIITSRAVVPRKVLLKDPELKGPPE